MITTRIGFIGLGLMGVPMCQRLLAAGFSLTVWNRTTEKTLPLKSSGAQVVSSIAELVENTDVIMLCVTDTQAVEAVVFASNGIIHRSEEHTSELQSRPHLVCRLLLEKKNCY